MKLRISAKARSDLREVGLYIAQDNPVRAATFVLELREACNGLVKRPHLFPLVPRHRESGLRCRTHKKYAIFYRVEEGSIEIVRILHGARDWERLLFSDV